MFFFRKHRESKIVAAVVVHVEPFLRAQELRESFEASVGPSKARAKSAEVLASEPSLLGFILGLIRGFLRVAGGGMSEDQERRLSAETLFYLFRNGGWDQIGPALAANAIDSEYFDGCSKGMKLVAYNYGADYTRDPDICKAIMAGRDLERIAASLELNMPDPDDERGQVVGGMQWMYFTAPFSDACRNYNCR